MTPPEHMSEADLLKLPKTELASRCWAATVTCDEAMQSASEAWAMVAKLTALLEDEKATEAVRLYLRLKAHEKHVRECRKGSCEHEFAALTKAGL